MYLKKNLGFMVLWAMALMVLSVATDEVEYVKGRQNYMNVGLANFNPPSAKHLDCVHQPGERGVCITSGAITWDSVLVYQEEEYKYAMPIITRDDVVNIKLLEPRQGVNLITFINVTNLQPVDELGFAQIIGGGVGQKNVTIYLQSQRGKGYRFLIEVYAASYYGQGQGQGRGRADYEQPTVTNNQPVYVAPGSSNMVQPKAIPVKIEHYPSPQQFQTGNQNPNLLL